MQACVPWMRKKSDRTPSPAEVKIWLTKRFDKKCREYEKKQ